MVDEKMAVPPREDFLKAVQAEGTVAFVDIIQRHHLPTDAMDIVDLVASLDRKTLTAVWQRLQVISAECILTFSRETADEEQLQEELENASKLLQGVLLVAIATIKMDDLVVFPALLETAVSFHGILMSLPASEVKLKRNIAQLCEMWWKCELEGGENLIAQTMLWLLKNTCSTKAKYADVKRVYDLRQCLTKMDMHCDDAAPLKAALQATLFAPRYIGLDKGRRFMAFLFILDPTFVESLHKTIKNQLPYCEKSVHAVYGEVYFRAWRMAEGEIKEKIELYCIQDLMYAAVHSSRGANSMSMVLRKVLGYFHEQRKLQPEVEKLIFRLYEPFLWKSLKVANPHVRANAVALFVDVFPLNSGKDMEELLQRQLDLLQTLMYDRNVTVRALTVRGICAIIADYWELLPSVTITWFVNHLVADLAWDGSSPEIRACVLAGMGRILDNHLSHSMLKVLLPNLQNLIHDTSELVRVSFLDLLLKVKCIHAITFWSIAPMKHILARMEEETHGGSVMRRIISLISDSFMPKDNSVNVQIQRCAALLDMNPEAARRFYYYVHEKMPLVDTVRFMTAIGQWVLMSVHRAKTVQDNGRNSPTSDDSEDEDLSVNDTDVIGGLLEIVVILWRGIGRKLKDPNGTSLDERLQLKYTKMLPEFYEAFSAARILASLILLASFLPANTIPVYSRSMLSKLNDVPDDVDVVAYGPMLDAMCRWGNAAEVLKLISNWLEAALSLDEVDTTLNKTRRSRSMKKLVARPQIALMYLGYLVRNLPCQEVLLNKHHTELVEVTKVLQTTTTVLEQRLVCSVTLSEATTDAFLIDAFDSYCRLEILTSIPDETRNTALATMEHLLTWAETELLVYLKRKKLIKRRLLNQTEMTLLGDADDDLLSTTAALSITNMTMNTTVGGTVKRGARDGQSAENINLVTKLVTILLETSRNSLLVGVADQDLLSQLNVFLECIYKTGEAGIFIEPLTSLIYQMTESSAAWHAEGVHMETDVMLTVMTNMLTMLSTLVQKKKEVAERVFPRIKSTLGQILQTYYRFSDLPNDDTFLMSVTASMLDEMTNTIKKDSSFEPCDKVTSLPPLTALFISAISRRKINQLLLAQLQACACSEEVVTLYTVAAMLHILHTFSHNIPEGISLSECLAGVRRQLDKVVIAEDISEDNPYRSLHSTAENMLCDLTTRFPMAEEEES